MTIKCVSPLRSVSSGTSTPFTCLPQSRTIDSVFQIDTLREQHQSAPLLREREKYLNYLFQIGTRRERVRNVATMLLHVMRLLEFEEPRSVDEFEIRQACDRWVCDPEARRHRRPGAASQYHFKLVATNWLRFQGMFVTPPPPCLPFGALLSEFIRDTTSQHGVAKATLKGYRKQLSTFLKWLQPRCADFSKVRAVDLEEYIDEKQRTWSRNSVAVHCRTLKRFLGYCEKRGLCSYGIKGVIRCPRLPRIAENLIGPPWETVRTAISLIDGTKPSDLRAKAMLLLFSVYGLRSAEVVNLKLEDIDWRKGMITVYRAKRGKTQQFPLQNEVGDAIALYLEKVRPRCECRNLFLTLNPPYRPVGGNSMSVIVNPRIKRTGIVVERYGAHMLRRTCATQLLRNGTSLREIADFLGHSDLRSVGIYAKFDPASLRSVAAISLRGIL
ncbi:site-specific integrase [Occallatibacter savannae]|uniref:site-specific integrase n=1 Tax=Occallatibacter savannae TaxID=1002691 RepID=UPI000D69EDC9